MFFSYWAPQIFSWWPFFLFLGDEFSPFFQKYFEQKNTLLQKNSLFFLGGGEGGKNAQKRGITY
jgi:hypothetical protein